MDSHIFLSKSDLQQLTGRLRPTAQRNWLLKRGWKFEVDAIGKPVVAVSEAERRLVGKSIKIFPNKEPNWE